MKRLCTICARGGSKGVPGKNVKLLAGIPVLAHSIRQARESGLFDCIAVSSDDDAILAVAEAEGALTIRRPAEMASDTAGKLPSIQHAFLTSEEKTGHTFDTHVDLDATAPLRLPEDIVAAVKLLEESGADNVITGMTARRSPYFNLVEVSPDGAVGLSKQRAKNVVRRQDAPPCYDMNASIYVWTREAITTDPKLFGEKTKLLVMPEVRSVDIDHPLDFKIVEMIMSEGLYHEGQSYPAPVPTPKGDE